MKSAAQRLAGMYWPWAWGIALGYVGIFVAVPVQGAQQASSAAAPSSAEPGIVVPRPEWRTLSAKAREQLAAVEQAVAEFNTPDAARAAGFQPVLGMIPTMGEHWVSVSRMIDPVSLLKPEQLMFSPVDGKLRLVGVAYAYFGEPADAPDLFDGDQDAWHAHPEFEIDQAPGQPLVMLHVWFVPSPDGPFAPHNPWLPYWAAGMQPPPDSTMMQAASAARARRLALALAEALEPMPLVSLVDSGEALPPEIERRRDSLRAMLPRLTTIRRTGDKAQWDREADAAIALWEEVRDRYLEAVPQERRPRLAEYYEAMATGGHMHMHDPEP